VSHFSYTQPFILVGALIERDGKFLLLQENHAPDQGRWNIPSGKLELGESPQDCVRREAKEEAGLAFTPTAILTITSVDRHDVGPQRDGHSHMLRIIYAGEATGDVSLAGGEPDADGNVEISQYRWLSPEEIIAPANLDLRHNDIPLAVKHYLDHHTLPLAAVDHIIQEPSPK
jgi:8-oxo-dGTP pyrophosphatase MutT (NUDIX family)